MTVSDRFKPGTGTTDCPECGKECEINHMTELSESIYCSNCRIKFIRKRKGIVRKEYNGYTFLRFIRTNTDPGPIITTTDSEPTPEKFNCSECAERLDTETAFHDKTLPIGKFEKINSGIAGNGGFKTLRCLCGEHHNVEQIEIGDPFVCDCGRKYELSVTMMGR